MRLALTTTTSDLSDNERFLFHFPINGQAWGWASMDLRGIYFSKKGAEKEGKKIKYGNLGKKYKK